MSTRLLPQMPHPKHHVQLLPLKKDIRTEKSSETFDKDDKRSGVVSIEGINKLARTLQLGKEDD